MNRIFILGLATAIGTGAALAAADPFIGTAGAGHSVPAAVWPVIGEFDIMSA